MKFNCYLACKKFLLGEAANLIIMRFIIVIERSFIKNVFYFHLQVSEGLSFLHSSVKMVHGNVTPENIILNKSGAWKIMGFDFCISSTNPSEQEVMKVLFFSFFKALEICDCI